MFCLPNHNRNFSLNTLFLCDSLFFSPELIKDAESCQTIHSNTTNKNLHQRLVSVSVIHLTRERAGSHPGSGPRVRLFCVCSPTNGARERNNCSAGFPRRSRTVVIGPQGIEGSCVSGSFNGTVTKLGVKSKNKSTQTSGQIFKEQRMMPTREAIRPYWWINNWRLGWVKGLLSRDTEDNLSRVAGRHVAPEDKTSWMERTCC